MSRNITVAKARQILNTKGSHLTDQQIEIILSALYRLSDSIITATIKSDEKRGGSLEM